MSTSILFTFVHGIVVNCEGIFMIAIQNDFGFGDILPRISEAISEMIQSVPKPKQKQHSTKATDKMVDDLIADLEFEANTFSNDSIIKLIEGYSSVLQEFEGKLIHFNKEMLEGFFDRSMVLEPELIDQAISSIGEHPEDISTFKLNSILIDLLQSFQRINLILDSIYSEEIVDENCDKYTEMIVRLHDEAGERVSFKSNQKEEILAFLND